MRLPRGQRNGGLIAEDLVRLPEHLRLFLGIARRRIDLRVVAEEIERVRMREDKSPNGDPDASPPQDLTSRRATGQMWNFQHAIPTVNSVHLDE